MSNALTLQLSRVWEAKAIMVLVLLFALLGAVSAMVGSVVYLICTPLMGSAVAMELMTLEERYRVSCYLEAMPFSRRQRVSAEFQTALITTAVAVILTLAPIALMMLVLGWSPDPEVMDGNVDGPASLLLLLLLYGTGTAMVFTGVMLAGIYYGMNKGVNIALGIAVGIGGLWLTGTAIMGIKLDIVMFVLGAAVLALSWHMSIKWYERRDL
jgi:hypothetical protein